MTGNTESENLAMHRSGRASMVASCSRMASAHDRIISPAQLAEVQASWAWLAPRAAALAEQFYATLFAADPQVKTLFRYADSALQSQKFLDMVGNIVHGMAAPAQAMPLLEELGRRHVDYAVEPRHYTVVGQALITTLAAQLGPRWTPATAAAWNALFAVLQDAMLRGAAQR